MRHQEIGLDALELIDSNILGLEAFASDIQDRTIPSSDIQKIKRFMLDVKQVIIEIAVRHKQDPFVQAGYQRFLRRYEELGYG